MAILRATKRLVAAVSLLCLGLIYFVGLRIDVEMVGRRHQHRGPDTVPIRNLTARMASEVTNIEGLMHARSRTVRKACRGLKPMTANATRAAFKHLIFLRREGILWCPVFKAGTTTWLHNLLELSYLSPSEKERLRRKYKQMPLDFLKAIMVEVNKTNYEELVDPEETRSFVIVRHPFTRLVSAFRDKLEMFRSKSKGQDYFYRKHGAKIVAKYRAAALDKFGESFFNKSNNYGTPVMPARNKRTANMPSFWEFVQYVKDTRPVEAMDEHWCPVSVFCSPCQIRYDYVVKFESLAEEGPFINSVLSPKNVLQNQVTFCPYIFCLAHS